MATLLGVVQNLTGFLLARFFLGVTESGLFPGVVFYFSMWYKRRERQFRIALFFSGAALAGAFGGILAYVCDSSSALRLPRLSHCNLAANPVLSPKPGHQLHARHCMAQRLALDFHSRKP